MSSLKPSSNNAAAESINSFTGDSLGNQMEDHQSYIAEVRCLWWWYGYLQRLWLLIWSDSSEPLFRHLVVPKDAPAVPLNSLGCLSVRA